MLLTIVCHKENSNQSEFETNERKNAFIVHLTRRALQVNVWLHFAHNSVQVNVWALLCANASGQFLIAAFSAYAALIINQIYKNFVWVRSQTDLVWQKNMQPRTRIYIYVLYKFCVWYGNKRDDRYILTCDRRARKDYKFSHFIFVFSFVCGFFATEKRFFVFSLFVFFLWPVLCRQKSVYWLILYLRARANFVVFYYIRCLCKSFIHILNLCAFKFSIRYRLYVLRGTHVCVRWTVLRLRYK